MNRQKIIDKLWNSKERQQKFDNDGTVVIMYDVNEKIIVYETHSVEDAEYFAKKLNERYNNLKTVEERGKLHRVFKYETYTKFPEGACGSQFTNTEGNIYVHGCGRPPGHDGKCRCYKCPTEWEDE